MVGIIIKLKGETYHPGRPYRALPCLTIIIVNENESGVQIFEYVMMKTSEAVSMTRTMSWNANQVGDTWLK